MYQVNVNNSFKARHASQKTHDAIPEVEKKLFISYKLEVQIYLT
jgi:hypothetical protein